MILITTAGKVGSGAARLLAQQEEPVRVLVRDRQKAATLAQAGVEVAEGDVGVPSTIDAAMQGVSSVVLGELSGTGVTATVVCPGLIATEWSGGMNHGNLDAMSAHDVAAAAWTAFAGGETVGIPARNNTDALARLAAAEAVVMAGGNRSVLADHSADRCPPRMHRLP
jgi:NAD(P)H-binding